jgi:phage repressor protein C with HTH and peptisase S24 domain
MGQKGIKSPAELAAALNYNSGEKLYRLFRNEDNKPSTDILTDLSNLFEGVNLTWLLTGNGPKFIEEPVAESAVNNIAEDRAVYQIANHNNGRIIYIPARAEAGLLAGYGNENFLDRMEKMWVPGFEDCDLAVMASGDSMYGNICNGDLILCKQLPDFSYVRWGEPYVLLADDGVVVKYVHQSPSGKDYFELRSENSHYPPYEIKRKRIRSIYLVKGKVSKNVGSQRDDWREAVTAQLLEIQRKIQ